MPYLKLWQGLFIALLLSSIVLTINLVPRLNIDTNLAELSPGQQRSSATDKAVAALQANIEKRIILLISGADEDQVFDAEEALRAALSQTDNISVQQGSDVFAETILDGLKDYRFSLLNHSQQQRLQDQSALQIASDAKQSMYSLSTARVYSFTDDPLGWHSETILGLLPNENSDNLNEVYSVVGLSIQQGALNLSSQEQLDRALFAIIEQIGIEFDVTIDRSGIFFFATEAAKRSKSDISLISTGSSIGVVLLLLFVFRSFRALLLPVASVLLGVGFAFLVTHLIYGKVHVLTIVFGASLIGIVIDYSLHYFYHGANGSFDNKTNGSFYHGAESHQSQTSTSEKNALFRALALSLLTSIIGYAALSFSSLEALQKVAVFSCCGLFMAWLSVICLGDLALRKPLTKEQSLLPALVKSAQNVAQQVSPRVCLCITALLLISGASIALINKPYNDDPRVFFNPEPALLASERRVAKVASDYEPGRYFIVSGNSLEQIYQRHQILINLIETSGELTRDQLTSLLSWVPGPKQQQEFYVAQAKLYGDSGAANILYQQLGKPAASQAIEEQYQAAQDKELTPSFVASMLEANLPPMWFEDGESLVSFVLIKKGSQADNLAALLKGQVGIEYVNTLSKTKTALSEQRVSASKLLLLAYLLVGLLMALRFRSLNAISLVLVPLSATSMLFIASAVFAFELNLFHIMALFLVLGFGMDYSIFAHEMHEHSQVTLQAILLSAVTSLLSFGLLGLSEIPVVASFGITLLVGNLFNLFGVFIYSRLKEPVK